MKVGTMWLPLAALMASGCAFMQPRLYSDYSVAPLTATDLDKYTQLTDALTSPTDKKAALVRTDCFRRKLIDTDDEQTCRAERNQAISALVFASEELCVAHRRTIYGNDAAWNVGLGSMTNLFAGAASVAAVTNVKSVLSGLALFSNSERSLVNETVYKTMLVTAVDKKIVESRALLMADIAAGMKLDINQYTMADALRNVTALHSSCSFMTGLQRALEEGTQSGNAQKLLRVKANLASLVLERNMIVLGPAAAASSPQLTKLDERITALSDLAAKLESE